MLDSVRQKQIDIVWDEAYKRAFRNGDPDHAFVRRVRVAVTEADKAVESYNELRRDQKAKKEKQAELNKSSDD